MIYIDIDDVVADFSGYVNLKCGTNLYNLQIGHGISIEGWKHFSRYHPRMFRDLEPNLEFINDGYEWIRDKFNDDQIAFLTSLPLGGQWEFRYAAQDKIDWIREYFGDRHNIFFGPYCHDKRNFCKSPDDILVDDIKNLCSEWIRTGGKAILFRNNKQFVQEFKEL